MANIFKCIILNEKMLISVRILLEVIPIGTINKIPALVQAPSQYLKQ